MPRLHAPRNEPDDLGPDERKALIARVVNSQTFSRSPRQKRLFLYLAERLLTGRTDHLTEQEIGQDVFDRSPGYNPSEDNIVRVAARQLRVRLEHYFNSEGRDETWILDVPKGGYLPVFRPKDQQSIDPDTHAGEPRPRGIGRHRQWAIPVAAFICLLAGYWIGHPGRMPAANAGHAEPELLSELFGRTSHRINVVLADTTLVLFQSLSGRMVPIKEYSAHSPETQTLTASLVHDSAWSALEGMPLTSITDVLFASTLLQSAISLHPRIRICHARRVSMSDFRTDDAIIVGGPRVNPWADLFEKDLNFQFRYRNPHSRGCISNQQPKPDEQVEYGSCTSTEDVVYSRIAWLPNLDRSANVLLVGGGGMEATQGACDFLLDPTSARTLKAALGVRDLGTLQSFEFLLRTTLNGGAASGTTLLAWRSVSRQSPNAR